MKSIRGIVLDVKQDHAIILTPDGDIRKVDTNRQKFELGQEILFYEVKPKKPAWKWYLLSSSALVASVLLFHAASTSSLLESPADKPPAPPVAESKQYTDKPDTGSEAVKHPVLNTDDQKDEQKDEQKAVKVTEALPVQPTAKKEKTTTEETVKQPEKVVPIDNQDSHQEKSPVEKAPSRETRKQQATQPAPARQTEQPEIQTELVQNKQSQNAPSTEPIMLTSNPPVIKVQVGLLDVVKGTISID